MNNNNIVEIIISVGELIDKVSILNVKRNKIIDNKKLQYIHQELSVLELKTKLFLDDLETKLSLEKLIEINSELWEVEDKIRDLESKKKFDDSFIELARKVYILNDRRFEEKNKINEYYNSSIREVKDYKKY